MKNEVNLPFYMSLCLDDGWKSAAMAAYPLLARYGMPATFYIISEMIDDVKYPQYMNVDDLRMLVENGHELGSHTRSHQHLITLTDEEVWAEITGGWDDMRALGFEPRSFAYTYGEWSPYVVKQVWESGFAMARSIERGVNDRRTNPMLLRANGVREADSISQVAEQICQAQLKGGWFILYFHQIEPPEVLRENGWIYGTTPNVLEGILAYIQNAGIQVVTVEKGMERMLEIGLGSECLTS